MNLILFILLSIVSYSQIDNEKNIEQQNISDNYYPIDTTYPCQLINPDTSIYGICLSDQLSSKKMLGKRIDWIEGGGDMPRNYFISNDKKQLLTLYFHYGGGINEYMEFEVSNNMTRIDTTILPTTEFITEKNIKIGISKESVIAKLGECYKIEKLLGHEIIRYNLDDFHNSEYLQRHNMPIYYAEYEFENNILIRFRFGFRYP